MFEELVYELAAHISTNYPRDLEDEDPLEVDELVKSIRGFIKENINLD